MLCDICCGRSSSCVKCARCDHSCCKVCARRWVTDAERGADRCPQCDCPWEVQDLVRRLGRSFYQRQYREYKSDFLFRSQQAHFHEDMHTVSITLERRKRNAAVEAALHAYKEFKRNLREIGDQERDVLRRLRLRIDEAIRNFTRPYDGLQYRRCAGCQTITNSECCEACGMITCGRCGMTHSPDEECDEGDVLTARAIRETCRPCVRCLAPCFKASGCDEMWCVNCRTFWNWTTGAVIDGAEPHNPDHRQWRAGTMREAGDWPCGGRPAFLLLETKTQGMDDAMRQLIFGSADSLRVVAILLRSSYSRVYDETTAFRGLRMQYLMKELTEFSFRKMLEQKHRIHLFRREVALIMETHSLGVLDVIQRMCADEIGPYECVHQLICLREMTQEELKQTSSLHRRKGPTLDVFGGWVTPHNRSTRLPYPPPPPRPTAAPVLAVTL